MISHEYKCIFIHIPKCAGTSVDCLLSGKSFMQWDEQNKIWLQHATAKQIKEWYCSEEVFNNYFKFTIIRNPFERVVSSYSRLSPRRKIPMNKAAFRDFVLMQGPFKKTLDKNKSGERYSRHHQLIPACDFLFDDNNHLLVDFVVRYEQLEKDWEVVCKKIGLPKKNLHKNKGIHKHYSSYYDEHTKKVIEERYKRDISFFNYKFENQGYRHYLSHYLIDQPTYRYKALRRVISKIFR